MLPPRMVRAHERGAEARKEARERYEEAETKSAQLADEAVKANPLAKIFGLRKQVLALDEKNAALRKLERVERYLGGSRDGGAGPFPGLAAGVCAGAEGLFVRS